MQVMIHFKKRSCEGVDFAKFINVSDTRSEEGFFSILLEEEKAIYQYPVDNIARIRYTSLEGEL